jgi:multiple sugar transport system substrate-binding protein
MHQSRFRKAALASVALAGAVALAACSTPSPEATEEPEFVEQITVWAFSSQVAAQVKEEFPKAYPDYTLDLVEIPLADLSQRLVVALQGGDEVPDVVQLPLRESGGLFATGQFMDLTAELEPMAEDFPEGIILGANGEINSFTMGPGNMGLWVNTAGLAKHGLEIPADPTWDEVADVARDLKAASGGTQYLFMQPPGANGANMFNAFYHSRGGNWWNDEGELAVDEDLAVETLEWLVGLDEEGLVYHGVWTEPTYWDAIRTEQVLGWTMNYGVGSTNLQKNVPEQSGQWQLITWPKWSASAEQFTGNFGGSLFAGLENAANQQGARDFIMWWLSDEGLAVQQEAFGLVPNERAAEVLDLDVEDPYFGGQTVAKDLGSVPYPAFNYFNWPATESALTVAVDQAYSGALTPAEAIRAAIEELEAL